MTAPDPTKDKTGAAAKVSLRDMLRSKSASRATESVTIYLDQAAAADIRTAERDLRDLADSEPLEVNGAKGKALARKVEAARKRMAESAVTFTLRALGQPEMAEVFTAMEGREDLDELNLRTYAAMCSQPEGTTWEDLRDLRDGNAADGVDGVGAVVIAETIAAAADRVAGGELTVPFSLSASQILKTRR